MSTLDLSNPNPLSGDALRDAVGNLLAPTWGAPKLEKLISGKKADLVFRKSEFGAEITMVVEAKDYESRLGRQDLAVIWADYSGPIERLAPATLLLVTRLGLTSSGQEFIESQSRMRHQTFWELENEAFGLTPYVRHLASLFDEAGLSQYYVEGRLAPAKYDAKHERQVAAETVSALAEIDRWLVSEDARPIAILGGYGAGKSSFAKRLVADQAQKALTDPLARRPILVELGKAVSASSLPALFGAKFTSEFPIAGFNYPNFLGLSDRGRLLMVLDGFDEMKHAMTWPDFRRQVKDLNRLTEGKAKVLLLGRPSAFLSAEEQFHVLRGLQRLGDNYARLQDWPEFVEYDLVAFDAAERASFVERYLRMVDQRRTQPRGEAWVIARSKEVNRLADTDRNMFSKPVHAKILTDLAADPDVDLGVFAKGVSRWTLYEHFFANLAERETDKEARAAIPDGWRLQFLRNLAFWLWSDRGGVTSFRAEELPDHLFAGLDAGDAPDFASVRREYLTGAFVEKKSEDFYYFGHRSFAEFLVAEQMVRNRPSVADHTVYSSLLRDGVEVFLDECTNKDAIHSWTTTLSEAKGELHFPYLRFLARVVGGVEKLAAELNTGSVLQVILEAFGDQIDWTPRSREGLLSAMRDRRDSVALTALDLLQIQVAATDVWTKPRLATEIAAALLDRVFEDAEFDPATTRASISVGREEARNLANHVIGGVHNVLGDRLLKLRGDALARRSTDHGRLGALRLYEHDMTATRAVAEEIDLPWLDVMQRLRLADPDKVNAYFRRHQSFSGVVTVGRTRQSRHK